MPAIWAAYILFNLVNCVSFHLLRAVVLQSFFETPRFVADWWRQLARVNSASRSSTAVDGSVPSALAAATSAFSSSKSRLSLARLFWNQVMTCPAESCRVDAMSSRSAGVKYFWRPKRRSSSPNCWFVNAVRVLRRFRHDRKHLAPATAISWWGWRAWCRCWFDNDDDLSP